MQGYDLNAKLKVEEVDGFEMVKKMAGDAFVMMQQKIDAVKRMKELAENLALDHKFDSERGERLKAGRYSYANAKKMNVLPEDDDGGGDKYERYLSMFRNYSDSRYAPGYVRMVLTANKHFSGIPVNTSETSVHVPTSVNDAEPRVINAIDWSSGYWLTDVFKDNYERDPSLSFQYFGSSTGFLLQYPAVKWPVNKDMPDMYDARMRDWYAKASASEKVTR